MPLPPIPEAIGTKDESSLCRQYPWMKRTHNEDNFFLLAEENIYVVADGMGGHSSGEVASRIAVETLANFFVDSARDREITWPHREDRALDYDANRLRVMGSCWPIDGYSRLHRATRSTAAWERQW